MQCKKLTFELEELQVWWVAYLQIVWWKTRGENVGGCHEGKYDKYDINMIVHVYYIIVYGKYETVTCAALLLIRDCQ